MWKGVVSRPWSAISNLPAMKARTSSRTALRKDGRRARRWRRYSRQNRFQSALVSGRAFGSVTSSGVSRVMPTRDQLAQGVSDRGSTPWLRSRMTRAGTPATVVCAGTSLSITEPAPMTAPSPILTGPRIFTLVPAKTPSPSSGASSVPGLGVLDARLHDGAILHQRCELANNPRYPVRQQSGPASIDTITFGV
jgi:hypothetical protein